jgi:heterotetrameric sarcosine oxidase gamma subunit
MSVLPTFSELPMVSPLAGIERTADTLTTGVGLGEITGRTLLHILGADGSSMKIGDVSVIPNGLVMKLRQYEFVRLTQDGQQALKQWNENIAESQRRIGAENVGHTTITDITHGRCVLLLVGDKAARVLPKVCGLDFRDKQFPNMHAAQTSLAKVRTLIIRADIDDETPTYALIVDRSLAAYVWDVVFDAAREFDGIALNSEAVKEVRKLLTW